MQLLMNIAGSFSSISELWIVSSFVVHVGYRPVHSITLYDAEQLMMQIVTVLFYYIKSMVHVNICTQNKG